MMLAPRRFLLLGFLALFTGCTSGPCVLPNQLSKVFSIKPDRSCYYVLTVTSIDMNNYFVKGKAPGPPDSTSGESPEVAFRVRDLDKLGNVIQINKMYHFIRRGNSPYLELFVGEPQLID